MLFAFVLFMCVLEFYAYFCRFVCVSSPVEQAFLFVCHMCIVSFISLLIRSRICLCLFCCDSLLL